EPIETIEQEVERKTELREKAEEERRKADEKRRLEEQLKSATPPPWIPPTDPSFDEYKKQHNENKDKSDH
ncbi:MAG: hypothetical protein GX633_05840, partial [Clostridiales bacterium]|nr:hypothetical protein [Clostridiales bacterium]